MPDAGEIKAKVTIEYNGEGVQQAKEDLASLAEAGGAVEAGAGSAGDALGSLQEQLGAGADSAKGFTEAAGGIEKPLQSAGEAAASMDAQTAHLSDSVGSVNDAISTLPPILEDTTKSFQDAVSPVADLQAAIEPASQSVSDFVDTTAQIPQVMPSVAESYKTVSDAAVSAFGGTGNEVYGPMTENMQVFQDALQNPQPFSMIQSYLGETGQTWGDFTSSIGEENTAFLKQMAETSNVSHAVFGTMQSDVASTSKIADTVDWNFVGPETDWMAGMKDATQTVADFGSAAQETGKSIDPLINAFGGVGKAMYGPERPSISMGEAFGGIGDVMQGMDQLFRPLMMVQMAGMAIQTLGTNLYNSAAIAEGPAAHSFGTFTGTVDALGQSMQATGSQFSEGFGQGILPVINALNSQAASGGGSAGGIGGFLGGIGSTLANLWQLGTGMNVQGGFEGLVNQGASLLGVAQPFQGPGPQSPSQVAYQQGIAAIPQTIATTTAQSQVQAQTLIDEVGSPQFLAAQDQLSAAQTFAQRMQTAYNISHPQAISSAFQGYTGGYDSLTNPDYFAGSQFVGPPSRSSGQATADVLYQQYLNSGQGRQDQANLPAAMNQPSIWDNIVKFFEPSSAGGYPDTGPAFVGNWARNLFSPGEGIGSMFSGLGSWFHNLFDPGQSLPPTATTSGGCFPAGTLVLLADGSERPIEQLRVGDRVKADDGTRLIAVPVRATVTFPLKSIYTLHLEDGRALTLTDSHPVMTAAGWKSLSPETTRREIPDLVVAPLHVGEHVQTVQGYATLLEISAHAGPVSVYNITVDEPHTYYASGVLVHNKADIGTQISTQVSGIQLPHIDLSGITSSLAGAFSSIQLPHLDLSGFTSGLSNLFSGIQLPHLDLSGFTSSISGAFSGIQLPHLDLSGMMSSIGSAFSGIHLPPLPDITGQIGSELGNLFSGIHLPPLPDIAGQIGSELGSLFSGIHLPSLPDIAGQLNDDMGKMFSGIQLPPLPDIAGQINQALSRMFSGTSLSPNIPMFGSGIEGFGGGLAVVGDGGPELVSLPAGSSVYPMSTGGGVGGGVSPLSLGGAGSGSMPQSVNVLVQLDSQSMIAALGLPLASNIRVMSGNRSS